MNRCVFHTVHDNIILPECTIGCKTLIRVLIFLYIFMYLVLNRQNSIVLLFHWSKYENSCMNF